MTHVWASALAALLLTGILFSAGSLARELRPERAQRVHLAALAAMYLTFVAVTWGRYMVVNTDWGKELADPARLLSGKLLYKDVFWVYGPLVPYLHAAAYKIFGVRLLTIEVLALTASLGLLLLTYCLAVRVLPKELALLAAFLYFATCISARHHLMPYTFSMLYAELLSAAALIFTLKFIHPEQGRPHDLYLAGFCAGIAIWSKHVTGILLVAGISAFLWGKEIAERRGGESKPGRPAIPAFLGLSLGVGMLPTLLFLVGVPFALLKLQLVSSRALHIYTGVAYPDLIRMITLQYARAGPRAEAFPLPVAMYFAGLFWLPVTAALCVAVRQWRQQRRGRPVEWGICLVLVAYLWASLQDVIWVHLLFVGSISSVLVVAGFWSERSRGMVLLTALACYGVFGLTLNLFTYLRKDHVVQTPFGTFRAERDVATGLLAVLQALERQAVPKDGLFALEDANVFYALYGAESPVMYGTQFWHVLATEEQQRALLEELDGKSIKCVLVPGWDSFGRNMRDVYPWLFSYLDQKYALAEQVPYPRWNGVSLLVRKP